MSLPKVRSSLFGSRLLALGLLLGASHCSSAGTKPGDNTSADPAGASDDDAGTGGHSNLDAGKPGDGQPSPRDASATQSDGAMAPGSVVVGGLDAGEVLGDCKVAELKPCGTFTTPTDVHLQLGPYGAQLDLNAGKGFENEIQAGDSSGDSLTCQIFTGIFGEDQRLTDQLLETTMNGVTVDFSLYSVYHPVRWPNEKIPVITWGNGTCAQPEGYSALLHYVASFGYFVVAANSRWVGNGSPEPMLHALDYAAAANADPTSPYYQKLDLSRVGAMGHSQGGAATISAAKDSRVNNVIVFNGGDTGVTKPYLALSGDMDVSSTTAASMAADIKAASVPAAWLYYHNPVGVGSLRGHLVLMLSPDRVTGPTVAWWEMMFRNDAASRDMFVGPSCGLCNKASDVEYGQQGLK